MHLKFQRRFLHLQDLLGDYEDELKTVPPDTANKQPASGGWTIAQIVYHILVVEKGIILYIQKKLQSPSESKRSGIKSFYRAALLRYALRSKRKFRAPKVLVNPQGPYEISELMNDWKKTRSELEDLLNSVEDTDTSRQLFKHPVVGKINLKQTLGFMADHKQRHLQQIKQIKREFTL